MSRPRISVIVIVRNGERFIHEALDSILLQGDRIGEIVIIDGNSTDRTVEIAQSYDKVVIYPQTGKGFSQAYNQGIQIAKHDLIAFLSHDDIWTADKLEIQLPHMEKDPNLLFTISHFKFFMEPGTESLSGYKKSVMEGPKIGFLPETLIARKSVFTQIGLFDTAIGMGHDIDWFSRAIDADIPYKVLPDVLLHKRIHGDNSSLKVQSQIKDIFEVVVKSVRRKKQISAATKGQ